MHAQEEEEEDAHMGIVRFPGWVVVDKAAGLWLG